MRPLRDGALGVTQQFGDDVRRVLGPAAVRGGGIGLATLASLALLPAAANAFV